MRKLAGCAALWLLAGCATVTPDFEVRETKSAAVEWRMEGERVELRAEYSRGDGDALRLVVIRGRPVLVLTRMRGEWIASGVLARGGWRGNWNTAPRELGGWLCLAEAIDAGGHAPEGLSEFRTGRMSVRYAKPGGVLREIELAAVATDDRFRVRF